MRRRSLPIICRGPLICLKKTAELTRVCRRQAIHTTESFDFLKDIVANVPDIVSAPEEGKGKGKGRSKKKESDDAEMAEAAPVAAAGVGEAEEDDDDDEDDDYY